MASPSMTFNAQYNALASGALAAGASTTFTLDLSAKFEGQLTIHNTPGGSVAATRGLQVFLYSAEDSTPHYETIGRQIGLLPSQTASTAESKTFFLSTGKYTVGLVNLDATNGLTVGATLNTVDSVS